jgi:hypothetical protein
VRVFRRKPVVVGLRNTAAVVVLKLLYRLENLFVSGEWLTAMLRAPVSQAEPAVRGATCSDLLVFRVSAML